MIFSIIFWLAVIAYYSVSNINPVGDYYSSFFDSKNYYFYMEKNDFLHAACHITESLYKSSIGIENYIDDFCEATKRSKKISDKAFRALCIPMFMKAYKYRKHTKLFSRMIALWGIVCYDFLQTIFVVCLVSSIVSYAYYHQYVNYMDSLHIALFYLTPICVFLTAIALEIFLFKIDLDRPLIKIAFIITFCVSFPIAIINNDWTTAIEEYNQEMSEEFGDD